MSATILDFTHIDEMRRLPGRKGGTMFEEFALLFFKEEPSRIAQVHGLAERREWEELFRMAHTVAGSCSMLGALDMQQSALLVQAAAKARSEEKAATALAALDASWKKLREALKKHRLPPQGWDDDSSTTT